MSQKERVQIVLEAINNVKAEAKKALDSGDLVKYSNKMLDLGGLENCLVTECEMLVKE